MKKRQYNKIGLFACMAVLAMSIPVHAADLAQATGVLAELWVLVSDANTALAASALNGTPEEIEAILSSLTELENAVKDAEDAYSDLAKATPGSEEEAAAIIALGNAKAKASNIASGVSTPVETGGEAGANGSSGGSSNINPYGDLSDSANAAKLFGELFAIISETSNSIASDVEKDATPE